LRNAVALIRIAPAYRGRALPHFGRCSAAHPGRSARRLHSGQGQGSAKVAAASVVLIDDKLRILAAVKKIWGERVTTVFPKQGHYARDPNTLAEYPPADIELAKIGDLLACDLSTFLKEHGSSERS
jgi:hypothetical protein